MHDPTVFEAKQKGRQLSFPFLSICLSSSSQERLERICFQALSSFLRCCLSTIFYLTGSIQLSVQNARTNSMISFPMLLNGSNKISLSQYWQQNVKCWSSNLIFHQILLLNAFWVRHREITHLGHNSWYLTLNLKWLSLLQGESVNLFKALFKYLKHFSKEIPTSIYWS